MSFLVVKPFMVQKHECILDADLNIPKVKVNDTQPPQESQVDDNQIDNSLRDIWGRHLDRLRLSLYYFVPLLDLSRKLCGVSRITCNKTNRKRHDFMHEVSPSGDFSDHSRLTPSSSSSSSLLSHLRRFSDGTTPPPLLFNTATCDATRAP